jgi:hypothetical protein
MIQVKRFAARWALAPIALACGLAALPGAGRADLIVDSNHYCSAGSNPSKTGDTSPGSLLSLGDVTLLTVSSVPSYRHASDCYGSFDAGNSSPANEVNAINEIFGPGFSYLDKTGGPSSSAGLGGFKWEIHSLGGEDGAIGLWSITWAALNPSAWEELPLTIDLAVLLMGGNQSAVYLLTGVLIPTGPAFGIGTFDIEFFNGSATKCDQTGRKEDNSDKGNKIEHNKDKDKCKPRQPSISHITLAGRIAPTIEVPEPGSLALFGAGVLGFWIFRRRQAA